MVLVFQDALYTTASGPFADNAALSMARAAAAAQVLREAGVPPAALTISAAGTAVSPYQDTGGGMARNRTVTLRVTPPS